MSDSFKPKWVVSSALEQALMVKKQKKKEEDKGRIKKNL